jgi:hypothetical protein
MLQHNNLNKKNQVSNNTKKYNPGNNKIYWCGEKLK